jgi:hypothetical protein
MSLHETLYEAVGAVKSAIAALRSTLPDPAASVRLQDAVDELEAMVLRGAVPPRAPGQDVATDDERRYALVQILVQRNHCASAWEAESIVRALREKRERDEKEAAEFACKPEHGLPKDHLVATINDLRSELASLGRSYREVCAMLKAKEDAEAAAKAAAEKVEPKP